MSEHTPGPWLVHSTNRLIVPAEDAFKAAKIKNGAAHGDDLPRSICLLRDPVDDFSEDETLANGFLIAAAPELYEAVEQSTALMQEIADATGISWWPAYSKALRERCKVNRAALAKARGEAPQ